MGTEIGKGKGIVKRKGEGGKKIVSKRGNKSSE